MIFYRALEMIVVNKVLCDLCGACIGVCPVDVISLEKCELHLDSDVCTGCMVCIHICPVKALSEDG